MYTPFRENTGDERVIWSMLEEKEKKKGAAQAAGWAEGAQCPQPHQEAWPAEVSVDGRPRPQWSPSGSLTAGFSNLAGPLKTWGALKKQPSLGLHTKKFKYKKSGVDSGQLTLSLTPWWFWCLVHVESHWQVVEMPFELTLTSKKPLFQPT